MTRPLPTLTDDEIRRCPAADAEAGFGAAEGASAEGTLVTSQKVHLTASLAAEGGKGAPQRGHSMTRRSGIGGADGSRTHV